MREEFFVLTKRFIMIGDHPRACGKNTAVVADKSTWPGSPPRMREEY